MGADYIQLFNAFVTATAGKSASNRLNTEVKYTNEIGLDATKANDELKKYFTAAAGDDGKLSTHEFAKAMGFTNRAAERILGDYKLSSSVYDVNPDQFIDDYLAGIDTDHSGTLSAAEKETLLQDEAAPRLPNDSKMMAQHMITSSKEQRIANDLSFGTDTRVTSGYDETEAIDDATDYLTEAAKQDGAVSTLSDDDWSKATGLSLGVIEYLKAKYPTLDFTQAADGAKVLAALDAQDGRDGIIGSDRKKWLEQKAADAGHENTYATAKTKNTGGLLGNLLKPITDLLGGKSGSSGSGDGLKGILTLAGLFFGAKALFSLFKKDKPQQLSYY